MTLSSVHYLKKLSWTFVFLGFLISLYITSFRYVFSPFFLLLSCSYFFLSSFTSISFFLFLHFLLFLTIFWCCFLAYSSWIFLSLFLLCFSSGIALLYTLVDFSNSWGRLTIKEKKLLFCKVSVWTMSTVLQIFCSTLEEFRFQLVANIQYKRRSCYFPWTYIILYVGKSVQSGIFNDGSRNCLLGPVKYLEGKKGRVGKFLMMTFASHSFLLFISWRLTWVACPPTPAHWAPASSFSCLLVLKTSARVRFSRQNLKIVERLKWNKIWNKNLVSA